MLTVGIFVDAPPPAAVAAEHAVSASCEAVVGPSRCPPTRSLTAASITTWVVVLRPKDDQWSSISFDFHDRNTEGALLEHRELGFSQRDALEDRWVSAGAVVAAFVAARDVDAAEAADRYQPAPPPSGESAQHPWALDVAVFGGSGAREPLLRFGALGRVSFEVPRAPAVISVLSARYAERAGSTALRWWSAALGLGARLRPHESELGAELTGQLVFEQLLVSARDPDSALEDSTGVNRLGGRLELNLFWRLWPNLGATLGGDVHLLRPEVTLYEGDRRLGLESSVGYAVNAGVRFWP